MTLDKSDQVRSLSTNRAVWHSQTVESKCVYHGTWCLVPSDGEVVCRIFGNVIRRIEDAGMYGTDPNVPVIEHTARRNAEVLGTAMPVLSSRSCKIYVRREADSIWYQRIRKVADQFNIKKSIREDIEFTFSLLRRKTSHRPSLIMFFAFYNTCRDRGIATINEENLRNAVCKCCNLKSMYSILKVYGMFAVEAQKLGIYKNNRSSWFYFNAFLRSASESLDLDDADRNLIEHRARRKYISLPMSMNEKVRTKNAFLSVLGKKVFETVKEVKY